jgi:hypothetical protein
MGGMRSCWRGEKRGSGCDLVPELRADARLDSAVAALRASRAHLARAVDPAGTTVGLVALVSHWCARARQS